MAMQISNDSRLRDVLGNDNQTFKKHKDYKYKRDIEFGAFTKFETSSWGNRTSYDSVPQPWQVQIGND